MVALTYESTKKLVESKNSISDVLKSNRNREKDMTLRLLSIKLEQGVELYYFFGRFGTTFFVGIIDFFV